MKFIGIKINLILLLIILVSCHVEKSKIDLLEKALSTQLKSKSLKDFEWIAYVSEQGCHGCNESFKNLLEHEINSTKGIIILTSSGSILDFSKFMDDSVTNVMFISEIELRKVGILKKSGIVFLSNNQVDTIIEIQSDNLENQLSEIKRRLD
jgi:hypothetical protein